MPESVFMLWITAVELPLLGGLFWLIQSQRSRFDRYVQNQSLLFSGFRLEVAKGYVTLEHLKEVEHRVTSHLRRIEEKLDGQRDEYHKNANMGKIRHDR